MSEPKLCPYRTFVELWEGFSGERKFGPCLQDKCAMWRMNGGGYFAINPPEDLIAIMKEAASKTIPIGFCGLAGRP
jgi:hypothetical protein